MLWACTYKGSGNYKMPEKSRDHRVDWIRAICSLTIILAHVGAPSMVNQIRTFDVVSLVFVSGISMSYSQKREYREYVQQRVEKLLFPTYAVISFIFILSFFTCEFLHTKQLYSIGQMIRSFLLLNSGSMGYVWIVRVYLCIAVFHPIIKSIASSLNSKWKLYFFEGLSVATGYIMYSIREIIQYDLAKDIFTDYVYSTFVYCVIVVLAVWSSANKTEQKAICTEMAVIFVTIQIVMSFKDVGFAPGAFKFPPRLYYCVYGLLCTYILLLAVPNKRNNAIEWVSKNSFMIYLFHIIMLRCYGLATKMKPFRTLEKLWVVEYIMVTIGAMIMVVLWNNVNMKWIRRKK